MKNLKNRQQGFTIIEVMIVLVIAAVILLIVFLAVPALQRNSRNTQRKNDVSRVASEVSNFVSNNNGAVFVAGTSNANLTSVINAVGNTGQYTLTAGSTLTVVSGASAAVGPMTTLSNIVIVTGAQCDTATQGATVPGSSRQMAVQYALETAGSTTTGTAACQNI